MAAAILEYQQTRFSQAVLQHVHEPMALVYLSDGWARVVSETRKSSINVEDTCVRVMRKGKLRHEFLCQRGFLLCDTFEGNEIFNVLYAEIVGLKKGATAAHVFTAACEFLDTLRQAGHRGICWNVYVQDCLIHRALTRLFTARHELFYEMGLCEETEDGPSAEQCRDTDFTIGIRCCAHSC